MGRHLVRFLVSEDVIRRALDMPDTSHILSIHEERQFDYPYFRFVVETPDVPEVLEGQEPPDVTPIIHKIAEQHIWDWNVPE